MTNIENITRLMESHPMNQLFIMDAIQKCSEATAKLTDEEVAEMQEKNWMVNMSQWRESARRIQKALNQEETPATELPKTVKWKTVENLVSETSFGIVGREKGVELDCSLTIEDEDGGYFEFYDLETGGESWYAEGRLEIENKVITGYDGVFELPEFLQKKLQEIGYDCSEL